MTTTYEPWAPPGRRRRLDAVQEESVLRPQDPPIYAAMAQQWRQAGRMVPGQLDRQWTELVDAAPRPSPTTG